MKGTVAFSAQKLKLDKIPKIPKVIMIWDNSTFGLQNAHRTCLKSINRNWLQKNSILWINIGESW